MKGWMDKCWEQRDLAIATISRVFIPPCNPFRGRQLSDQHSLVTRIGTLAVHCKLCCANRCSAGSRRTIKHEPCQVFEARMIVRANAQVGAVPNAVDMDAGQIHRRWRQSHHKRMLMVQFAANFSKLVRNRRGSCIPHPFDRHSICFVRFTTDAIFLIGAHRNDSAAPPFGTNHA
jgi:hypothetical protein